MGILYLRKLNYPAELVLITPHMKHLSIILLVIIGFVASAQPIQGVVVDADTKEPLPFVSILYNAGSNLGTTTDVDGKFKIPDRRDIAKVEVSSIGFEPKTFEKSEVPRNSPWLINLKSLNTQLEEATVIPGENPALRMVRNAIARADSNDPEKYATYTYKAYLKNVLTRNLDSVVSARQQLGLMESDSTDMANKRYMMISESVSRVKSKSPESYDEKILGTRISGFKNTSYAIGAENLQYFGLYDNVVQVLTEYYITPLAPGADKKYFYILQDTIIRGQDSTFIMYYQPKKGSNFEGLKGEMHLNTNGWALEYIYAEPYYKGNIDFVMEHHYTHIDNKYWFPQELSILMQLERLPLVNDPGFIYSKLFVDSARVNIPIPDDEFDHVKRELSEKAAYVEDDFWENHRKEELNTKELKTYQHMDSIGDRYKFSFFANGARKIYYGYFTIEPFEYRVNKFLRYSGYEGLRFGAGVYTSEKLSENWRIGGYYGYGTRDKAFKYGGTLDYYFSRKDNHRLRLDYKSDVIQPGYINFKYYRNTGFWNTVFINHMDHIDELSLTYKRMLSKYMTLEVGLRDFTITANNNYQFIPDSKPDASPVSSFRFTEANLNWRWAYKENITSNFGSQISAGTDWPVLVAKYGRGISGFINGEYDYNRVELGLWWYRYFKGLGHLDFRIETGYVDRVLPIQVLFSNRATYSSSIAIVATNSFNTMRFNEFFSDKYATMYLNHNFGPLLFRTPLFSPEFEVYHAMSFGTMSGKDQHIGYDFKTLEHGYFESGLVIDNIFHINFFKVGYMGFGAGGFYRYGAYHLPKEFDNWAIKMSIIYTIN